MLRLVQQSAVLLPLLLYLNPLLDHNSLPSHDCIGHHPDSNLLVRPRGDQPVMLLLHVLHDPCDLFLHSEATSDLGDGSDSIGMAVEDDACVLG